MEKIIHDFVENDSSNGLLLLDMPTGSGKTYSVLHYIYESIVERKSTTKFFFITTLKKNLPENDLRKFFKDAGYEALFDEKFLRIDSNADSVKDGLTNEVVKKIPQEIRKWDEYKKLQDYVYLINNTKQSNAAKSLRKVAEDVLRTEIEPAFRKKLQSALNKAFPTVKEKLNAVRLNSDWQWVAKLYPAVFTREKQIIFMSMDKFLVQNSTIVEPSYMLYNSEVIKDAVIFIDEFDATKETILKNIIQNGLRDKIDFIELFKDIHAALQTHDFPADLTRPSEQRKNGEYKDQSLQSIIDGIKEKAGSIYNTYSLNFSHKTKNVDDSSKNFLFQDHQYHSILDGNKSYILTKRDNTQRINSIEYGADKPEKEENNIQIMLGKIRGFITYFQNGVRILAINYQQCKAERRQPTDDEFTLEAALRSILEQFRPSRTNIDYLVAQILIASHKSKGGIQGSSYDLSFYENGFRYYSFEDSSDFDMQSKIMMYSFQNTPERVLLRFCEKAKIIGISATATVPTNIGNFDVEYLKMKLSDNFYEVNADDKERLRKNFEKSQNEYAGVHICTELLGCDTYDKDAWTTVYEDVELAEYTYNKLEREIYDSKDNSSYNKQRILRIACAFKQFLLHDDIQSFLCILTKHPRSGDTVLNFDILIEIFGYLSKKFKYGFIAKDHVVQLDGDEYDEKKDDIIKRLGNGEKIFVISVYQTIGAGQNLQYPIPDNRKENLVCLNAERKNFEKDFDALYLDKPTNILVQLKEGLQEEEFAKYIYQIEYLQEACEFSATEAMTNIKKAFACYSSGKLNNLPYVNPYDRQSVVLMSTKLIIQAIGRICRTYMKPENIYIYADKNIVNSVDLSVLEGRYFNYEFQALMEAVEKNCKSVKSSLAENAGNLISIRTNKHINNMIRENWTNERIEKWKTLRELVLKYPTASSSDLNAENKFIVSNFYVRLPSESNELFYRQQEDYNNISISFERNRTFPLTVSEKAAKLTKLMQISEIKTYFEKKGYATDFARNEYIMSPALFNNIYKGALGEVVGKLLFYLYTGKSIVLDEIEDIELFELFDFKVPDSDIYIDFKDWQESSRFSDDEMVDKIRRKTKECGCKCVIVANLMANAGNIRRRKMDDFELIEIPAMVDENNLTFIADAAEEIMRCVREYSD